MTARQTLMRIAWPMLALAVVLWAGLARAEESGWDSHFTARACDVIYQVKPDGSPLWTNLVGIEWRTDGSFAFVLLAQNLERQKVVPLQVSGASGAVFSGDAMAEKPDEKGPHAYLMAVDGRKDLDKSLMGDLTFTYRDQKGKIVVITAPFGMAVPRVDACVSNAAGLAQAAQGAKKPPAEDGDEDETQNSGPPAKPGDVVSSGTGVAIDQVGRVITVAHVVDSCGFMSSPGLGRGEVVAVDPASDLALLRFPRHPPLAIVFRAGPLHLAEPVVAAGFPLADILQNGLNVTVGNLSALSGAQGDRRQIQFSAPTTFGNSGGPVMDGSGRLVGLVDAGMNAKAGQDINFAVAGPTIRSFLDENGVNYQIGNAAPATPAQIAAQARGHTVLLLCHK